MSDEKVQGDNVIPMVKKPRGRPKSAMTKDQLRAMIQTAIFKWLTGDAPLNVGERPFGDAFRVYKPGPKIPVEIIHVKNGIATITDKDALFTEIWDHMWLDGWINMDYRLEEKYLNSVVNLFMKKKHRLFLSKAPEIICWDSEKDKIAFTRLMDPPSTGFFWPDPRFVELAPVYSNFLARCEIPYLVRQFLGSMLYVDADRKMVLVNYGQSNAGKTIFLNALLEALFGDIGFGVLEIDPGRDSFSKEAMINKLAILGDETNPEFFKSALFKQLTGSRKHAVNRKHEKKIQVELCFKMVFAMNELPELLRDSSFTNRVLLNKVENLKPAQLLSEAQIRTQLKEEMPYIIGDIKQAHNELYGKKIIIPEGNHEAAHIRAEMSLQLLFDQLFEYIEKDPVTGKEYRHMTSAQFAEILNPWLNSRELTARKFYSFLKSKYGIESQSTTVNFDGVATRLRFMPRLKARPK